MDVLHFPPVPDAYYEQLGYPKEGKTSDLVVISRDEADALYEAASECFRMVDEATEFVIRNGLYADVGIPDYMAPIIERTYTDYRKHPHMLGRFDFAGGTNGLPIKLIEFNADTPFSIFEVSTVQYALAKYHGLNPDENQYNRLFEELQAFFRYLGERLVLPRVLFTNAEDGEDDLNTLLLREAASESLPGDYAHWTDVCIDERCGFCTVDGERIRNLYNVVVKMVPWDLLFHEDENMARWMAKTMERQPDTVVCNPPYAAIYQSKYLMKILCELFPDSPYLLKTSTLPLTGPYVAKPVWGREGQNIRIEDGVRSERTGGFYSDQPLIYQELARLAERDGQFYQAGVFISMETPCGIGFRRASRRIITTDDHLCGHIIRG